jgi:hypothetical protein
MKFILFSAMSLFLSSSFAAPVKNKISNDKMIECGQIAADLSLKLTEALYPKKEGVNPIEVPTPPYQIGSLDPSFKENFLPISQHKNLLKYATGVFTKNENWECAYFVTMEVQQNGSCFFVKIEMNNCGGGVHYQPKKK